MTEFTLLGKDKTSGRYTFEVKNTSPAMANAIRRSSLELVPTMAIDTVEIRKNNGPLYDEMLAHRLGLLPLKTDLKAYNEPQKCKCNGEGCAQCTLQLTLKTKGPCTVYAKDIKSQDPKVTPVHPDTPIAKLAKGQELEFIATAKMGTGTEHAKFSPGLVWYTYKPSIKINNNHPEFDKFKDRYPPLAFKNGKLDASEIEKHNLFDVCEGINKDILDVQHDDKTMIMHVEPWGQLHPREILTTAISRINEQLDQLQEAFK